jgi:hypothetical protein
MIRSGESSEDETMLMSDDNPNEKFMTKMPHHMPTPPKQYKPKPVPPPQSVKMPGIRSSGRRK